MCKMQMFALAVVSALAITSASPLMLKAQNAGTAPAPVEDMPHRTTKAFAPFIRALVMHRVNTAQQIFKIRRSAEISLDNPETERILNRFQKPDRLELNLVGGRTLGNNIGILFFTVATEEGPVAFKIFFYGFDKDINVSRIDVMDDWDTIEQESAGLENLPAPISMPLSGQTDDGGQ